VPRAGRPERLAGQQIQGDPVVGLDPSVCGSYW
jgi:hypothetical protein